MIRPQDSLQMIMNPKKPEQRVLAVILGVVATVGLLFASFSRQWIYNSTSFGEMGFGAMGMSSCETLPTRPRTCLEMSNGELVETWREAIVTKRHSFEQLVQSGAPATEITEADTLLNIFIEEHHTSGGFPIAGWVAFIGCLVAGVSIAISVILVALKKRPRVPIMPTTTALLAIMAAIIGGCLFVATKPGGALGVGLGFWGFAVGCIMGIAATLMLNRSLAPVDDELDAMNEKDF